MVLIGTFYERSPGFGIRTVLYKGEGCATSGNTGHYGIQKRHVENPWYAIDFNTRKGTIRKLCDKDLNKQLLRRDAEWEMGRVCL